MKAKIFLIAVVVWGLASCNQAQRKQSAIETSSEYNGEENFKVFLEKFGTDSLFQLSRIIFPLKVLEYAWDDDGNMIPYDDYGNFIEDSVIISIINLENHIFLGGFTSNSSRIEIYDYEYTLPNPT